MAGTTADKLELLATNKANIKAAIVAKNPSTAPTDVMSQWPTAIASIPTGGTIPEWTPPTDWPNLRSLLANDTETAYTNKTYILFNKCSYPTVAFNFPKWITSDSATYNGNATHTWTGSGTYGWVCLYSNAAQTIYFEFNSFPKRAVLWICANLGITVTTPGCTFIQSIESEGTVKIQGYYSTGRSALGGCNTLRQVKNMAVGTVGNNTRGMFESCYCLPKVSDEIDVSGVQNLSRMFFNCNLLVAVPDELDLSAATDCSQMFSQCYSLTAVPDTLDLSAATNVSNMFSGCYSLTAVPDTLDLSAATNVSNMFYQCYSLTAVPDTLDLSAATNVSSMFSQCYSLTAVPDTLDLSAATNVSNMFYQCYSLTAVPTHLTINLSFSFAQSNYVSKASVATFDADGVVNGGMIYNLNTCPNSGQTVTLNSTIKAKFTSDEQTAIVTALTAKNWSIAW